MTLPVVAFSKSMLTGRQNDHRRTAGEQHAIKIPSTLHRYTSGSAELLPRPPPELDYRGDRTGEAASVTTPVLVLTLPPNWTLQ